MHDLWKFIVVTITGLVLAGTAVGIVAAQSGEDTTPSPTAEDEATPSDDANGAPADDAEDADTDKTELKDNYLDSLAGNLGVSREELDAALQQTGLDLLDQAVADGRITEDEAANIRERIESGEGLFPFFPGHHGGPGGFRHGFMVGANLEEIAEFLGVDRQVVIDGLQNEQSLAQIAEANGSSRDALVAFLLEQATERANEAVANERITQAQADEMLANAGERINDLVDREGLPDHPGRHFGPGRFGPGDDGAGDETETDTSGLTF
ncbi:MAG: hypothetical protein WEE64_11500 [Dehalococcoidia bacterium]